MKTQNITSKVSDVTSRMDTSTAPSASYERTQHSETAKPGPLEELSQNDDAEVILSPE